MGRPHTVKQRGSNVIPVAGAEQGVNMFCTHCGKSVPDDAMSCPECGTPITSRPTPPENGGTAAPGAQAAPAEACSPKNRLALSLLAGFLGVLGAHRFYAGRILSGIIMLLLFLAGLFAVLCSAIILVASYSQEAIPVMIAGGILLVLLEIWLLIDIVLALCGRFRDRNGRRITQWQQ